MERRLALIVSFRTFLPLLFVACLAAGVRLCAGEGPFARFDAASGTWTLGNEQVSIVFEPASDGSFQFVRISNLVADECL